MAEAKAGNRIGTALLHEDERIRIWEMDLAPGEETELHHHAHDYVLVVVDGDRVAGVPGPDEDPTVNPYVEADVHPGQVFVMKRGGTEVARNIGSKRYHEIIVELKDDPAPDDRDR